MKVPQPTASRLIGSPSLPSVKYFWPSRAFGGHSPLNRLPSIGTVTSR